LAGDLAYQEVPESQLRDSTGIHTGFAFKPPCSGWAPKRNIEFDLFYIRNAVRSSYFYAILRFSLVENLYAWRIKPMAV